MQPFDVGFWIMFLIPLSIGLISGWWLRGIHEQEVDDDLRVARMNHPAYRQRWEWDD